MALDDHRSNTICRILTTQQFSHINILPSADLFNERCLIPSTTIMGVSWVALVERLNRPWHGGKTRPGVMRRGFTGREDKSWGGPLRGEHFMLDNNSIGGHGQCIYKEISWHNHTEARTTDGLPLLITLELWSRICHLPTSQGSVPIQTYNWQLQKYPQS